MLPLSFGMGVPAFGSKAPGIQYLSPEAPATLCSPASRFELDLHCVYNCFVNSSLNILNLYWNSLQFRSGPNFSFRINCWKRSVVDQDLTSNQNGSNI